MAKQEPKDFSRMNEDQKMKFMRDMVDNTAEKLKDENLSYDDARKLIQETRKKVLALFPDKGDVFDMIHKPRFYRILDEKMKSL
ncbi:MAG TPA: hypothetical protein VGB26_01005 [Nitrospiria bacterium]|jgi:hypothetical protein